MLPKILAIQKVKSGRSRDRKTRAIAVAKGKNLNTTEPWAAGTCCIAQADSTENPKTLKSDSQSTPKLLFLGNGLMGEPQSNSC
ncbi:hypothetical protein [Microcoleus sp. F4-D5]|uniref:hypothetical protein n=1 Tax=Microcoleus sp. F4-D5 TaxID=2818760 RepID=UPI002FD382E5